MNKRKNFFFSAGLSSILLVFVLLCLITFAVLSLSGANTDYKLSKKTADRTRAYYAAEAAASETLEEIDQFLLEQYHKSGGPAEFTENVRNNFEEKENRRAKETDEGMEISFTQKIDEEEVLEAVLSVGFPDKDGDGLYRIRKWQTVQKSQWKPDTALPVMQQMK